MAILPLLRFPRGYEKYLRTSTIILVAGLAFGIIFGATMVKFLDFYQREQLETSLNYYLQISDEGGQISKAKIATNSLNTNGIYILYTTLCGLAVVGLPLVWGMVFLRGVVLGFTVGYLVERLAWRGLVFCLVTLFPYTLVTIPVAILAGAQAMSFSWLIINKVFGVGDRTPPPLLGYLICMAAAFLVMFLLAMLEAATVPWLLERMLPWLQP